jgi:hypothetical protein
MIVLWLKLHQIDMSATPLQAHTSKNWDHQRLDSLKDSREDTKRFITTPEKKGFLKAVGSD